MSVSLTNKTETDWKLFVSANMVHICSCMCSAFHIKSIDIKHFTRLMDADQGGGKKQSSDYSGVYLHAFSTF